MVALAACSEPIANRDPTGEVFPTLASAWIDDGMRSGIPEEDWAVVVTLYGSAATPVAELAARRVE